MPSLHPCRQQGADVSGRRRSRRRALRTRHLQLERADRSHRGDKLRCVCGTRRGAWRPGRAARMYACATGTAG
eukprot:1191722-Alexandrium_andersonii.AAC.1